MLCRINGIALLVLLVLTGASCNQKQSSSDSSLDATASGIHPQEQAHTASTAKASDWYGAIAPGEMVSVPLKTPEAASLEAGEPSEASEQATLFESLSPERTGVEHQMKLADPYQNIKEYMLLSVYGGSCTGDFDSDGLVDFFVTSPIGGGRLYRNLGDFRFQDVTEEYGIGLGKDFWGTGATFADINNDGRLDLYVCSYKSPNKLFINQSSGPNGTRFVEQAKKFGLGYRGASMTMAFADIDLDGDLDGYLATTGLAPPPGTEFQVQFENGKPVVLENLREYWELLYLPGDRAHRTEAGQYDHLYRNDGDRFTEITKQAGVEGAYFTLSATWWDYNQDGLPDLYASNDFLGPDSLYKNLGDGRFEDTIRKVIPHSPWFSMGSDIGDVNNDGLIDMIAADMSATTHYRDKMMMGNMEDSGWFLEYAEPRQYMRNALYVNTGDGGRFMEAAFMAGIASTNWTWTPRLADLDNDGRLDLFVTNGMLRDAMNSDASEYSKKTLIEGSADWVKYWAEQPMFKEKNLAFRNAGELKFKETSESWGLDREGVSFGAATADFDNDGDLDIIVNNADAPVSIYRNNSVDGNRLRVSLTGTLSNRFGVGATVRIEAGDFEQVQYVTLSRGWLSSCEPTLHFGLGEANKVDRLTINWPSGITQELTDIDANSHCIICEPNDKALIAKQAAPKKKLTWFDESNLLTGIKHEETPFDDFAEQPLLPNRLSRSGPAMAWADVDGDGYQDCFLGSSFDRPGQLFVSGGRSGKLESVQISLFVKDSQCEDVDAVFFDADSDGDQDLYVVSGSNEAKAGDTAYADRLYLNQGQGKFTKANSDVLPEAFFSGSVVVAADYDKDGDQDLFVGTRCIPGRYPEAPQSQLLLNEGGKFVDATPPELAAAGLVTGATWADINSDGMTDLVVATDWGPLKIFTNVDGQLTETTESAGLTSRTGWWTSVTAGDIDNDGDIDLVATNFGLNNKYKASPEKPELLYYGDVDGSGKDHIIEAKYIGDTCFPRRGFSCSRNAMPLLQEKTKSFHQFATSTLVDLYSDDRLTNAIQLEATELRSGLLRNDGTGKFDFEPLPRIAQIAPSMSACLSDFNADGYLDICLAQNFYGPQRETGHMDGGVGLVLAGNEDGNFTPLPPTISGIVASGDARQVEVTDLNNDGLSDIVFAFNNGPAVAYLQSPVAALLQTTHEQNTPFKSRIATTHKN